MQQQHVAAEVCVERCIGRAVFSLLNGDIDESSFGLSLEVAQIATPEWHNNIRRFRATC